MLSPKVLRFWAARCLRSANGTDKPDAITELRVMARDLERRARDQPPHLGVRTVQNHQRKLPAGLRSTPGAPMLRVVSSRPSAKASSPIEMPSPQR